MSFAKSKTKRFNEVSGCGPPVGLYDPNYNEDGSKGPASFEKSNRFKIPKEPSLTNSSFTFITPKKLFNTSQSSESSAKKYPKKPAVSTSLNNSKVTDLERELKNLLQERTQLLKDVSSKEQECKKIDSKLQTASREKTYLNANIASLVKELKSLRKGNEVLKAKISTLENNGIKRNECMNELGQLKENLIERKHEIEELSDQMKVSQKNYLEKIEQCNAKDNKLLTAQNELENVRSSYDDINSLVRDLTINNAKLDEQVFELHNERIEIEGRMKELQEINTKLENEQQMFIGEMDSLQERHATEVHDFLSKMSDLSTENTKLKSDFASLKIKIESSLQENKLLEEDKACSALLQEYKNTLEERIVVQNHTITELQAQQDKNENLISNLKIDVQYLRKELTEKEQLMFENQAEIAEYIENIEQLKENEKSLTENIKCFTNRCQELNEMIEFERDTNKEQEERLQSQIELTQSSLNKANEEIAEISANNIVLISQLHSEKNLSNQKIQELKELELKFAENTQSLEIKAKDFCELWEVSQQKDKELEVMHKGKEMCIEELDGVKQEFQRSQNVLDVLRAEIAQVKSECDKKDKKLYVLQTDKNTLISDLEKCAKEHQDTCDSYQNQLEEFSQEKECQSARIVELTESLANSEVEKLHILTQLREVELNKAEEEFSELLKAKMDSDELHKEFHMLREMLNMSTENEELMKCEIERLTSKCQELFVDNSKENRKLEEMPLLQEKFEKLEQEMQDKEISYLAELSAADSENTKKIMELEQTTDKLRHENHSNASEIEKWKHLYEQTLPFKEQADLYSLEKKQLTEQKAEVEVNYNMLKEQYAELLGHNNKKQKIRHIMKLKQDNQDLKEELDKTRELCSKQKWQLDSVEQRFLVGDVKRKSTLLGKENFVKPLSQTGNILKNQMPKKSLSQSNILQNSAPPRVSTNYGLL